MKLKQQNANVLKIATLLATAGLFAIVSPAAIAADPYPNKQAAKDANVPVKPSEDSGLNSVAISDSYTAGGALASGFNSVAVGVEAEALKQYTIAVGSEAKAKVNSAIAIGQEAVSEGVSDVAIGAKTSSAGGSGIAMGYGAQVTTGAQGGTAVGAGSSAEAVHATALGIDSHATGVKSTAIGVHAKASHSDTLAVGNDSIASGERSIAIGGAAVATSRVGIAIGVQANASGGSGVALGRGAKAQDEFSVAIGSAAQTEAATKVTEAEVNGITYSGFAGSENIATVSFGTAGETGIKRSLVNVAAGRISETSTDAINGSQLYLVANQVGDNKIDIEGNKTNIAKNAEEIAKGLNFEDKAGNSTNTKLGGTLQIHNGSDNTVVTVSEGNVTIDVAQDQNLNSTTYENVVISKTGLDLGGTKATNMADGVVSADSKDGVNGSQLHATNVKVEKNAGDIVTNAGNIAKNAGDIAKLDKRVTQHDTDIKAAKTEVVAGRNVSVNKSVGKNGQDIYEVNANAPTLQAGKNIQLETIEMEGTPVGYVINAVAEKTTVVGDGQYITVSTNQIDGGTEYKVQLDSTINDRLNQVEVNKAAIATNTASINGLNGRVSHVEHKLNQLQEADKELKAGVAGAMAMAGIDRPNEANKSLVGLSVGGYDGQHAVALGYATNSDNNKWSVKGTVSFDTQKNVGYNTSVMYQW